MAHKCNSPDCEFSLPDNYPLDKCPWHMVPGRGPVKIGAAAVSEHEPGRRFSIHSRRVTDALVKRAYDLPAGDKLATVDARVHLS